MKKYFGFIDETGVLHNSINQRFFALGLLKCESTSILYEQLCGLKNRIESKLALVKQQQGLQTSEKFEFKFNQITKTSHTFYFELIESFFKFKEISFCAFVLDKDNPKIRVDHFFKTTWDAYISFSKLLIEKNIKNDEEICLVADYLGKPKVSPLYYDSELKRVKQVFNAAMIESHASLYIQLVDVLIGSVVYDFRRNRQPGNHDYYKSKVSEFLKQKLGTSNLAGNVTFNSPNYFSIWEFMG